MSYTLTITCEDETLTRERLSLTDVVDSLLATFGGAMPLADMASRLYSVGAYCDCICGAYVTVTSFRH